jgi:hypothetical protein
MFANAYPFAFQQPSTPLILELCFVEVSLLRRRAIVLHSSQRAGLVNFSCAWRISMYSLLPPASISLYSSQRAMSLRWKTLLTNVTPSGAILFLLIGISLLVPLIIIVFLIVIILLVVIIPSSSSLLLFLFLLLLHPLVPY